VRWQVEASKENAVSAVAEAEMRNFLLMSVVWTYYCCQHSLAKPLAAACSAAGSA
jgi:hypothetical protein